jgi:hypothetical protein
LLTHKKDYEILVNGELKVIVPLMYTAIVRLATLDGNGEGTFVFNTQADDGIIDTIKIP